MTYVPVNGLVTVAEIKTLVRTTSTDTADDDEIAHMIEEVSDTLNAATNRQFYPSYETLSYDTPAYGADLVLNHDVAEVLTLTNGDGTAFNASDYKLYPLNGYPKNRLKLLGSATQQWLAASGDPEGAIALAAVVCMHETYDRGAWKNLTTLGAAVVDTTGLSWTLTSGSNVVMGQTLRVGTELVRVASISGTALTLDARGINGSTAATHLNGVTVQLFTPMPLIVRVTKLLVKHFYDQRFGEGVGGTAHITGAGVIITPAGFPDAVSEMLSQGGLTMPGIG